MIKINDNFAKLPESYLFSTIARKVKEYKDANPDANIISLGIGDVTRPICKAAIDAMHNAVDDEANAETFYGYGPEQGYDFLREKIAQIDYRNRGVEMDPSCIFISDGAKSDLGNITDLFSNECIVAVTDPVYPVYVDTNVMAGRAGRLVNGNWSRIEYLPCNKKHAFVPQLPALTPDLIYMCYPNNPTGTTLTRDELLKWVRYAKLHGCLILFDSAYEAFISDTDVPHSIYEIPGAKEVAIEFRSFSKTAGFTGLRCGYTVVPDELYGIDSEGNKIQLRKLWNRRQTTKFNGASYIVQRGAEAIYSYEGRRQIRESIEYYKHNAAILREGMRALNYEVYGGRNAPYVWVKTPGETTSWEYFDRLLQECKIVCTPGSGFGNSGEGYVRFTAFNTLENTREAVARIANLKK